MSYASSIQRYYIIFVIFVCFNFKKYVVFFQNKFGTPREVRTNQGLVEGHAYSVTHVTQIPIYNGAQLIPLLRIRNPWGGFEWNGTTFKN